MIPDGISNGARVAFARLEHEKAAAENRARIAENALDRLTVAVDRLAARLESAQAASRRLPAPPGASDATDLLYGFEAIAQHLRMTPRQAKHLASKAAIPVFKLPGVRSVCARRSTLVTWLADQKTAMEGH